MEDLRIDLSTYRSDFSIKNKALRLIWIFCYWILFRPFFPNMFNVWRVLLLRVFGAKVGSQTVIYSSSVIWAPWNLEIANNSCIGPSVKCYNQGKINIGSHTIISQNVYLCASTHDYTKSNFPLILKPILIEDQVWIAADTFIAPGVLIGKGAVVGARSAVFKNVKPWSVVGGNPAQFIKERIIKGKYNA